MPEHIRLNQGNDIASVVALLKNVQKMSSRQQTSNSGSFFIPADDEWEPDEEDSSYGADSRPGIVTGDSAVDFGGIARKNKNGELEPLVDTEAISNEVEKAQDDAQSALDKAGQASDTATSAQTSANLALANAPECVLNGDFANGTANWSLDANRDVVNVSGRGNVLHVVLDNTNFDQGIRQNSVGQRLGYSSKARVIRVGWDYCINSRSISGAAKWLITIRDTPNGKWYYEYGFVLNNQPLGQWLHYETTYTIPENNTIDQFWFLSRGLSSGDAADLYLDNISVKDITEVKAAQDTADTAKQTAQGAKADAANAVTTANSANDTSAHASSTAQAALSAAQSAQQDTVTQWVPQYAVNQSPSDAPTTGWSNTQPAWTAGHYIWMRTVVGYGSGDYDYSNPVLLTGNPGETGPAGATGATGAKGDKGDTGEKGPKGDTGERGPAGPDGKDGTSVTIKGTVASVSALPSSAAVGDGYITADDGHLHVWGDSGFTDVGAIRGPNGVSAYVHTAWADSSDGKTNFSTTSGGTRAYMGVYSDNSVPDSTSPSDYVWTLIKGATGAQGATGAKGDKGDKGDTGATGAAGADGANGVSVTAITPYWALGTSAPAQPAVSAPPRPWQSTEPGYSRNQHLYKTSKVTYSNGQFAYTPVVMDSSYEYSAAAESSARDAVQTATNANTTAQTAKSTADSASSTASTAKSTAEVASSVATQANATAVSANQSATSAQTSANLALANAPEYILNGSFTDGTAKWFLKPNIDVVNVSGRGNVLHVVLDNTNTYEYIISQDSIEQRLGYSARPRTIRVGWDYCINSRSLSGYVGWRVSVRDKPGGTWLGEIGYGVNTPELGQWLHFEATYYLPANNTLDRFWFLVRGLSSGDAADLYLDNISVKDITEAQAAQKAADDAQATADTANITAQNATTIANAAQAAAKGAQTTADGKNKIFSANSEPAHTGLVPGDLWFQLDSSSHVTGIQVWNGSAFVDYVLMANQILVAGSVGTIQLADGAITTPKLTITEEMVAELLKAKKIEAGDIDLNTLNGQTINGLVINGATVRTASSGTRVEISNYKPDMGGSLDSGAIRFFNSQGSIVGLISVDENGLLNIMTGQFDADGKPDPEYYANITNVFGTLTLLAKNGVSFITGGGQLDFTRDGTLHSNQSIYINNNEVASQSGWVNLGYGSGYKKQTFGHVPRIMRMGDVVFAQGTALKNSGNIAADDHPFGAIPVGYRPDATQYATVTCAGNYMANIQINTNGTINLKGAPTGGAPWLTLDSCVWQTTDSFPTS